MHDLVLDTLKQLDLIGISIMYDLDGIKGMILDSDTTKLYAVMTNKLLSQDQILDVAMTLGKF